MTNAFVEPLVKYWSRLEGTIHPDDQPIFDRWTAAGYFPLNTTYPPPAFVGNIRTARIFVLKANGGYTSDTRREFEHPGAADSFRAALRNPCNAREGLTAPYYLKLGKKTLSAWLRSGEAAIVNAVAYRAPGSPSLEDADQLPSLAQHREWFREELARAAGRGAVRVIVHRPKLWGDPRDQTGVKVIQDQLEQHRKYLPQCARDWAQEFLASKNGSSAGP